MKFGIVCEPKTEMGFKDLMVVKTRQPGFFFEYKKNRTELLKVKVPPTKERFYKKFIREQQEQQDKEQKMKLQQEKRQTDI